MKSTKRGVFDRFLDDNNALEAYYRMLDINGKEWPRINAASIRSAFSWPDDIEKGGLFWCDIHEKWALECGRAIKCID